MLEYLNMKKENLIFLETETTGADLENDRLCQVCYKQYGDIFTEYFKPPVPISIKSMSITHITNKTVENKEAFKGSKMCCDLENLLSKNVLIAHNAKFDIAMLEAEGLSVPKSICTFRLARYLDEEDEIPEYNLQYLRYYHGLEIDGSAHDAEGDVKVLAGIFDVLYKKMTQKLGTDDEEKIITEMIDISSKPSLIRKMPFGKHCGISLKELAKTDSGYLQWLLRQKEEDGDEDWVYSLHYWLDRQNSLF